MADSINPHADVIDSREVIERFEELEARATEEDEGLFPDPLDEDEKEELESLRSLLDDLRHSSEEKPEYGITMIADSYFTDYAQQTAEDIGAISSDASWPLYCIDWERAARDLQMDYTSVEWEGQTFWVR